MNTKKPAIQAHGFTHAQLKQIKQNQIDGTIEMIPANRAKEGMIKDELFAKQYTDHKIPAHEAHIYHMAMESRLFSTATGERLSIARVQKFDVENFNLVKDRLPGYTIAILHDPTIVKKTTK